MDSNDPRIDSYIARAAPFAQPILERLREAVHAGCPGVSETIKWGMPFFVDEDRILANMAAFKAHCAFGFWRGRELGGGEQEGEAMGQFGRITALADLPPKRELVARVKAAAAEARTKAGQVRPAKRASPPKPALEPPAAFVEALAAAPAAGRFFDSLPPGKRREYVDWIAEAKRDATREQRIAQAVQWLGEGKARYWKYENC